MGRGPGLRATSSEQDQFQIFLTASSPSQHFRGSSWAPRFLPALRLLPRHKGHTVTWPLSTRMMDPSGVSGPPRLLPHHSWEGHHPCSQLATVIPAPTAAPLPGMKLPRHPSNFPQYMDMCLNQQTSGSHYYPFYRSWQEVLCTPLIDWSFWWLLSSFQERL